MRCCGGHCALLTAVRGRRTLSEVIEAAIQALKSPRKLRRRRKVEWSRAGSVKVQKNRSGRGRGLLGLIQSSDSRPLSLVQAELALTGSMSYFAA